MPVPVPTILVTLSGPAGSVDVAARCDTPLLELAAATEAMLGLGDLSNAALAATHFRVGADPKSATVTASLASLEALDGDAIVFSPSPKPVKSERR